MVSKRFNLFKIKPRDYFKIAMGMNLIRKRGKDGCM